MAAGGNNTNLETPSSPRRGLPAAASRRNILPMRSEERRVGEECRFRWWAYHLKKKNLIYTYDLAYQLNHLRSTDSLLRSSFVRIVIILYLIFVSILVSLHLQHDTHTLSSVVARGR